MKQIEIPYLSHGLWRYLKRWRSFFSESEISVGIRRNSTSAVLGWGYKRSGERAIKLAKQSISRSVLLIEDGFLRSMDLGVNGEDPLSLVVDDLGIYYDASKQSRLEKIILDKAALSVSLQDAGKAMQLVIEHQLTKYNYLPVGLPASFIQDKSKKQILIIDQTYGDMSLVYGGVMQTTFQKMVNTARKENPNSEIWIKIHPDVLTGKKQGNLTDYLEDDDIHLIAEDIHPHSLLKSMDKIYVATSQMGFEALLLGKEVITFGLPWYAGWGLTDDRHPDIEVLYDKGRRREASLLELFAAAYLNYCRYINPFTNERGTIFDVIDYLVMMKEREKLLQGEICVVGLSWWKRQIMTPFLKTTGNQLHFFKNSQALKSALKKRDHSSIRLLLWGKKFPELETWALENEISILRMEDGFIRSVGLGSNLVAPRSLVIDDCGIYFDASQRSRLEHILETTDFNDSLLQEAMQLQAQLIAAKVGKYNVGSREISAQLPANKRILLVPGQVEDDASIQTGTREISTNLGLLKYVRQHNSDAYIIYKPHPDVVSGNRVGNIPQNEALQYADIILPETDILELIEKCDELHTMTSLSGFEALLRHKEVFCYGIPFYAGWGLTTDLYKLENRRKRRLTLSELIAGTLLLYPEYLDTKTGQLTNAKATLDAIAKERLQMQNQRLKTNWPMRKWQQLRGLMRTLKW